jgi:hypothetical protein
MIVRGLEVFKYTPMILPLRIPFIEEKVIASVTNLVMKLFPKFVYDEYSTLFASICQTVELTDCGLQIATLTS